MLDVERWMLKAFRVPFRYCLNASTIRGTPIMRQIEVAARAGFGAIELWFSDLDAHLATGGTIADLRHALRDSGLAVPTAIYLGGWFDAADAGWPRIKAECGRRLDQAAELGAAYVIAGPPEGHADIALGARRYGELLALGEAAGALPAMEFLGFVAQFKTLESALEVIEKAAHPRGTIVVDPFHIFRGGGSVEAIAQLHAGQIAVAHFNDTPRSPTREHQHDADRVWPGDGHLDLRRYLALLRGVGFGGWLSLELFREELWARDPLEVARLGLEKMRAVAEA
jgi:sugar phosphate isomerase/epimerase